MPLTDYSMLDSGPYENIVKFYKHSILNLKSIHNTLNNWIAAPKYKPPPNTIKTNNL